jgi:hypothetical protein
MQPLPFLKSLALVLAIPLTAGLATCRAVHEVAGTGVPEPRTAGTPRFTPPANGELSAAQIDMFLRVRPHEQAILKQPGGEPPEAEVRAAREAGVEPEEYRWVKERIARAVLVRYRIAYKNLGRGRMMRDLVLAQSVIGDPVVRAEVSRQIEALQNGDAIPQTPALRHNVGLVARNQERLLRGEGLNEIQALLSGRLPTSEAGS